MSRSGYSENECDSQEEQWAQIRWRGAVASALRGKRGQAFIRELKEQLEAMPEKKLIAEELINENGEVCAVACVMKARGIDMTDVEIDDFERIADLCNVNEKVIQEIEWENDQARKFYVGPHVGYQNTAMTHWDTSPETRWKEMHAWCEAQLR